jgi:hypothetical protein
MDVQTTETPCDRRVLAPGDASDLLPGPDRVLWRAELLIRGEPFVSGADRETGTGGAIPLVSDRGLGGTMIDHGFG